MDQTTSGAQSQTPTLSHHNPYTLSHSVGDGFVNGVHEIARPTRIIPSVHSVASSDVSSGTPFFTIHDSSSITRPTSLTTACTPLLDDIKGKGKAMRAYSSSLSGTDGSASEAEVEKRAILNHDLLALGAWADTELNLTQTLKGGARAKPLGRPSALPKQKKLKVILSHASLPQLPIARQASVPLDVTSVPGHPYSRPQVPHHTYVPRPPIEGGGMLIMPVPNVAAKSLSNARVYSLAGIVIVTILTVIAATFAASHTGKGRLSATKSIIFAATSLTACFTIVALLVARRSVSEALLAGLLNLLFGFTLLLEIDSFLS